MTTAICAPVRGGRYESKFRDPGRTIVRTCTVYRRQVSWLTALPVGGCIQWRNRTGLAPVSLFSAVPREQRHRLQYALFSFLTSSI